MEPTTTSTNSMAEANLRAGLKAISYLLQYPDKKWLQLQELINETKELEHSAIRNQILQFLNTIAEKSMDDLSTHYVNHFDFNAASTMYLSFLKAGEQKERGALLVELKTLYNEHGFQLTEEELSDYLPVVLEFAAIGPLQISINLLSSFQEPLEKLHGELEKQNSPYAILIQTTITIVEQLKPLKQTKERKE